MSSRSPYLIERSREFLSLNATRTRTLRTNFLWNAAGSAIFALSQWAILVVFAKLGSAALVGQIVYGLALVLPLFVVAGLQLRSIHATDVDNRHTIAQYLGLRALTTILAAIIVALAAIAMWSSAGQLALFTVLWALARTVDSGSEALYGIFQQSERMDYVGVSFTLRGILAVSSVAVIFRFSHSAPLALGGLVVAWAAVFVLFDIPMARSLLRQQARPAYTLGTTAETLRPVINRRQLTPLCLEAAPLGIVAFLLAFQGQAPRYVIEGLLHTRELGLFSAAAYLTFVGATLVNALGAPASVRLAQYHIAGARSSFRHLMTRLILVAGALGVAGVLLSAFAGSRILALLYTKEYSQMAGVLTMLCAGSAVFYLASFLGYGMTALRRYRIQVPIFSAVVLITLLSCYFLTERYGLMGTAIGILIGNLGQLLLSAAVVWQTTRMSNKQIGPGSCATVGTEEFVL
jgi:O-antigen/teichoic acid export membrane protein